MIDNHSNQKIAKYLGIVSYDKWGPLYFIRGRYEQHCPDYHNDLNAIHDALIIITEDMFSQYVSHLLEITGGNSFDDRNFLLANSSKCAEALLHVIKNAKPKKRPETK
jgi:hypothetical protein